MHEKLPVLFEGHASFELLEAFDAALFAFEDWLPGETEPAIDFAGRILPVSVVFGRLRNCTDLLPYRLRDDVEAIVPLAFEGVSEPLTYADAARILRAQCVDRMKASLAEPSSLSVAHVIAMRGHDCPK